MRKIFIISLLLSFLTGCNVGPSYHRPDIDIPAQWTIDYPQAVDLTNSRWWSRFGDPVLEDLLTRAVRQNLDLKTATARVDQYLGALGTNRSALYPQVDGLMGAETQRLAGASSDSFQVALNASWELDLWGRIRNATEAAKAELLASEAGRRIVLMTLVSNVGGGYFTLRGLDRQLEIIRETEKAYAEQLRLFRLRFQYGTISQLELSQAEIQYASARKAIPEYESLIRQQENLLALLLGQAPGTIPRGKSIEELTSPEIPVGLPSQLLERRPDIVQAEQNLVAANAQIGVAKAAYFPAISLTGLLGTASNDLDRLFGSDSETASLAGNVTAPLLNFGRISGQVQQAEALEQQANFQYQQTILTAFREVEDGLVKVTKGREQVAAEGNQVDGNKEYSRIARLQFEAGTTDYLQVLDADRSLFSGQLSLVQSQADVLVALVTVYKAMGGGWEIESEVQDGLVPASGEKQEKRGVRTE